MMLDRSVLKGRFLYYYERLSDGEKQAYDTMLDGMLSFKEKIPCHGCTCDELLEIYFSMKYDLPELFYVKSVTIRYRSFCPKICITMPEYRFDLESSRTMLATMESRCKALLCNIAALSQMEREKRIHDYLVQSVTYQDPQAPYSHEAAGPLLYGIGVCEGIAKAFKFLSDRAGLRTLVVVGTSNNNGAGEAHAWNMVWLDATTSFYHVDTTFDNTVSMGCLRYDYYNLSDEEMREDHKWDESYPDCANSMDYYRMTGMYFGKKSALIRFLRQLPRECRHVVFRLPMFREGKESLPQYLLTLACNNIPQRRLVISSNLDRMIFQLNIE